MLINLTRRGFWVVPVCWSLSYAVCFLQARGKKKQIGWFPANYVKVMTSTGAGSGSGSNKAKVCFSNFSFLRWSALRCYAVNIETPLIFAAFATSIFGKKNDCRVLTAWFLRLPLKRVTLLFYVFICGPGRNSSAGSQVHSNLVCFS